MPEKKMVRSVNHKKLCGVCAGLADYFDVSVAAVRLIFCLLALAWGTGVLAYFVAVLVLPKGETNH